MRAEMLDCCSLRIFISITSCLLLGFFCLLFVFWIFFLLEIIILWYVYFRIFLSISRVTVLIKYTIPSLNVNLKKKSSECFMFLSSPDIWHLHLLRGQTKSCHLIRCFIPGVFLVAE